MVQYATQSMMPHLQRVWTTCFGDPEDYARFLFQRLLRPSRILVSADSRGNVPAMLCLQPFDLYRDDGRIQKGSYIYGVATVPKARGQGLSTLLLEKAHLLLAQEGFHLSVLVPASESLFKFYGNRGYETAFSVNKAEVGAEAIPLSHRSCTLVPTSLEKCLELRDSFYGNRSLFVRWDGEYLSAITDECRYWGGEVLAVGCGGEMGYAVCYPHDDTVTIKELAVREELLGDVLAALHARYRANGYRIYLPADTQPPFSNKVLPFAMIKWYDKDKWAGGQEAGTPAWIAHVLD